MRVQSVAVKKVEASIVPGGNGGKAATAELLRILRTKYLDALGFWRVESGEGEPRMVFDRRAAAWHVLSLVPWTIFFGAMIAGFWWLVWTLSGGQPPWELTLALKVMAWTSGIGVFGFAFVGRTVEALLARRRGPWVVVDRYRRLVELPRHGLRVPGERVQWAVLHSEHTDDDRMIAISELMLTVVLEDGERCCISVTRRSGKRGLRELDEMARRLAEATGSELTCSGYAAEELRAGK